MQRLSAAVHVRLRLEQPDLLVLETEMRNLAFEFFLVAEYRTPLRSHCVGKPKPGIVPGLYMLLFGIA